MTNIIKHLKSKRGEGYVDTGIKVLIVVVLGVLVLSCLYALFNTTIMPSVKSKVESMFEYSDGGSSIAENVSTIEIASCNGKIENGTPYQIEVVAKNDSLKNVYLDSKELANMSEYIAGPKGDNTVLIISSSVVDSISSGEHTIKVVTDDGVLYHTVSK